MYNTFINKSCLLTAIYILESFIQSLMFLYFVRLSKTSLPYFQFSEIGWQSFWAEIVKWLLQK